MEKFLSGHELNGAIDTIFKEAKESITIISPYIKLHTHYINTLSRLKEEPNKKITVVFGKNEGNPSKSASIDDIDFFKNFPNVEIRYEKSLHAKLYCNDSSIIMTSMNLYSYSQESNIESGIRVEGALFGDNLHQEMSSFISSVVKNSELVYLKTPKFERTLLGLQGKYASSIIEKDTVNNLFRFEKKSPQQPQENQFGFCIRTGVKIPFNLQKPMCDPAYNSWSRFGDLNYNEKFCHFSGEPSYGETSFGNPVLRRNWNKAKTYM